MNQIFHFIDIVVVSALDKVGMTYYFCQGVRMDIRLQSDNFETNNRLFSDLEHGYDLVQAWVLVNMGRLV